MQLVSFRAVLAGAPPPALADLPGTRWVQRRETERATAPAAAYALEAVGDLCNEPAAEAAPGLATAALFILAAPAGSSIHLFDPARGEPPDRRLLAPGFPRRSRRIHPFTLLLSLHNQVAATLSMRLGLRGPCCNAIESAASFPDLIPLMELEARTRAVLLVMSSATDRGEERSHNVYATGRPHGLEGAIALLFHLAVPRALGVVSTAEPGEALPIGPRSASPPGSDWPFAPCLEPGLAVLWALATHLGEARFEIREPGRSSFFAWSAA